jgi:hypothetical protein
MLLSGLWHGAGWTFVVWGGLHGFFLLVSHHWHDWRKARGWELNYWWYRFLCLVGTFIVVLFAWVFFRAPTMTVAGQVLTSMVGGHGFTMSQAVTNPARFPGTLWAKLGVHFVPPTFPVDSYTDLLKLMVLMLAVAFFLPNSQRLLHGYSPALEPAERPRWFRPRLGWASGLFLGGAFFWVVRSFYVAAPSPFLYFNF